MKAIFVSRPFRSLLHSVTENTIMYAYFTFTIELFVIFTFLIVHSD